MNTASSNNPMGTTPSSVRRIRTLALGLTAACGLVAMPLTGCQQKQEPTSENTEKIKDSYNDAATALKDAVTPNDDAKEAGHKIQNTLEDTGETIKDAFAPDDPATEKAEKVEETVEQATSNN